MYFSIPLFFLDAICVCFVPVKSTAVFSTYLLLLKKVDTHISRKQYIPTSYAMLTFRGGYFSNKIMSSVPNWNKQQHTFDGYKTLRRVQLFKFFNIKMHIHSKLHWTI